MKKRELRCVWNGVITLFLFIFSSTFLTTVTADSIVDDHLLPEVPIIAFKNDYSLALRYFFNDSFSQDVLARVLITPPFKPEHIISVLEKNGVFYILILEADKRILDLYSDNKIDGHDVVIGKQLLFNNNKIIESINVRKTQTKISESLAEDLLYIWQKELLMVRQPESVPLTLDVTNYQFSMFVKKYGVVGGRILYAKKSSRMDALIKIVESLKGISDFDIEEISSMTKNYRNDLGEVNIFR